MTKPRKNHTPEFKLKAVIEVLKGEKTANQLAGELGVNPMVLSEWKRRFMDAGQEIFARRKRATDSMESKQTAELFEQIGRLKMENEWLKKKLNVLT
jgi:transposase-like protein